jgi:formylglycine-generating enzyme required for sulfatase activity
MAEKNFYKMLGVSQNADSSEITRAFRALALVYHPDRNQGNEKAEAIYKQISEAYETLKDAARRQSYDTLLKKRGRDRARRIRFSLSVAAMAAIVCVPAVLIALAKAPRYSPAAVRSETPALHGMNGDSDAFATGSIPPKGLGREASTNVGKTVLPAPAAVDANAPDKVAPQMPASPRADAGSIAGPANAHDITDDARRTETAAPQSVPAVSPPGSRMDHTLPEVQRASQPPLAERSPLAHANPVPSPNSRLASLKLDKDHASERNDTGQSSMRYVAPDHVEITVGTPGRERVETLRLGGGVRATFKDCDQCPEMTVLPPGSFKIGASNSEDGRWNAEGPQSMIVLPNPFAVSRMEISAAEWSACVAENGCSGGGKGQGKEPAGLIMWRDAQDYVAWLSRKTGKSYRLLSEAEWEYAARANSVSAYWWGDWISPSQANYASVFIGEEGGSAMVDAGLPNRWGLHHVHGNLAEWVADCWNESHDGLPSDGSPRLTGDCSKRVLKGGSWRDGPGEIRAASRRPADIGYRDRTIGLRVARAL